MAQTGNSCSNPYVMNLTNGAGNAEFQFHYPDTVMYVKIENSYLNQLALLQIDSLAPIEINRASVLNNNCFGNYIYDANTTLNGHKHLNLNLFLKGTEDTIMLRLIKTAYNSTCGGCDTSNLKITFSFSQGSGGTAPCTGNYTSICDNLVQNGDFELHISNLALADDFTNPTWGEYQFDNQVCEWFQALTGLNSPDYYSSYWNSYTFGGAPSCSFCSALSLTSSNWLCNIPTQTNNPFFNFNNNAYAGFYTDNSATNPELLKGNLNPNIPLINSHLYYVEGNFAQPNGLEFYGHMEVDITNQANFIQANYNNFTTGIEISFDAFDYDPISPWKKFYNVFTSNGDETNLFIGNLTRKYTLPQTTNASTNCPNLQTASMSYMLIDNIVVKEFLADAGGPTVSVCNNSPTVIGGSCHYPNVQYNWQPANLFNNNTLSNPTITTNVNVICTLTVTITMPDNSTATTPPAYVNVEVYQSPIINILGSNSIPIYTSTALTATGAVSYSWVGTNGTSGTGATFNTGALTQQETFTVTAFDANGCSAVESFVVNVTNMGGYCDDVLKLNNLVIIPDGYTSTQLKNYLLLSHPSNITMASNNGNGSYTYNISSTVSLPLTFLLAGTFTIDNVTGLKFNFANNFIGTPPPPNYSNFYCFDGSNIINNSYLTMTGCSLVACNNMWKGITNNKNLYLNGCYFADAENAVHLTNGSNYKISTNVFDNNLYGILMGGIGGGQITGVDYSNLFTSTNPLKPAFPTMFFHPTWSEAGIKVHNVNYVQIGAVPAALANFGAATISNRFENINCGINIFNSNVNVVNSWFKNITVMNPSPSGTLIGLKPEGTGVYARSIGNPKTLTVQPIPGYTGYEFEKCIYGIKAYKNSITANGLKMIDVKYGVFAQNCINGTYRLSENKISLAKTGGIILGQAQAANVIKLTYNEINLTSANQNKGIEILGSTLGAVTGNCFIKSNIVNVGAGAKGGILLSGLQAPKLLSNQVNKNMFYLTVNSSAGFDGFGISDCNTAYINCNTTTKNVSGGTNLGSDYKINQSPNGFISCNNSGASPYGFDFRGTSPGTTFRTNVMGSQSVGLYVGTSSVLGPQPALTSNATEGNQWTGTYSSGYGAKNLAVDPNDLQSILLHQFLVKANDGTAFIPAVSPSVWFDQSTHSHVPLCGNSCPSERGETNTNIEFYKAIARGTILTTDYPYESLWMLQGTLYEVLSKDPQLLIDNDSLALFYYSPDLEVIKKLKGVSDSLKGIEEIVKYYHLAINGNDSLIDLKQNEIETLQISILNDTINDSSLAYNLQIKLAQLELLLQTNNDVYHSLNELMDEHADNALTLNNEIEPGNANEAIEKDVNHIYLRTLAKGNTNFTVSEINLLNNIAHLCPMAAGPSVYRARSMYALINDTVVYQDSAVCAFEGYFRESANVLYPNITSAVKKEIIFIAMPNPASGNINFTFGAKFYNGNIIISNALGAQIQNIRVNENKTIINLNISDYAKGLYFANYTSDGNTNQTIKFIVK